MNIITIAKKHEKQMNNTIVLKLPPDPVRAEADREAGMV